MCAPGTAESPLETLQSVFDDIDAANGGSTGGPTTATDLEDSLLSMHDFIVDPVEGLPVYIERIKRRTAYRNPPPTSAASNPASGSPAASGTGGSLAASGTAGGSSGSGSPASSGTSGGSPAASGTAGSP